MKSLIQYIAEAQNDSYKKIFSAARRIQGEAEKDDAMDIIHNMEMWFKDRNYETLTLDEFKKECESGDGMYYIFDSENWVMCLWDRNHFNSATVQKERNDYYVNGNVYYAKDEFFEFLGKYYDGPKMKIWHGGF